jgi:hypothetical protein
VDVGFRWMRSRSAIRAVRVHEFDLAVFFPVKRRTVRFGLDASIGAVPNSSDEPEPSARTSTDPLTVTPGGIRRDRRSCRRRSHRPR